MEITLRADDLTGQAYLALPSGKPRGGVLVLHAWWGLVPFFRDLADRLAAAGYVALAPDLYNGATAATVAEAEALLSQRDDRRMALLASAALDELKSRNMPVAALGCSLGAAWSVWLATERPLDVAAAVLFYGAGEGNYDIAEASYLVHLVPNDAYEPEEYTEAMLAAMRGSAREVTVYRYPGTRHWFFEADRPEFDPEAAALAWERTTAFLREQLG